jgi:hypothetical protein
MGTTGAMAVTEQIDGIQHGDGALFFDGVEGKQQGWKGEYSAGVRAFIAGRRVG